MGKIEATSKISKHQTKPYRKTVLGSHNLALFLKPSHGDIISKQVAVQQLHNGGKEISALCLFESLKDINKFMVKGTKLYESLKELHLAGWVLPYTLILSGPSEDLKVVRHAWAKRNLKSPRGYFIKELVRVKKSMNTSTKRNDANVDDMLDMIVAGIVQDFIVQLVPQSPFMSLTSALYDAVADLNHQEVFPTKVDLYEYLRKHYQEIKTPDMKTIHECLGRLIKERRLYHNGQGYFILQNENVLNEIISTQDVENTDLAHVEGNRHLDESFESQAMTPFLKGFNAASSSVTTSSSPGQTDLDGQQTEKSSINPKSDEHDTSFSITPSVVKKMFKRTATPKVEKKIEKSNKSKIFSCGMGGTMTDSITILSNAPFSPSHANQPTFHANKSALETSTSDDEGMKRSKPLGKLREEVNPEFVGSRLKRSHSFSASDTNLAKDKEVSFALVGSPNHESSLMASKTNTKEKPFKKSYSFGVGYTRNLHKRPGRKSKPDKAGRPVHSISVAKSNANTMNRPIHENKSLAEFIDLEDYKYLDVENSFVNDSLPPVATSETNFRPRSQDINHPKEEAVDSDLIHRPDMKPAITKLPAEAQQENLSKYRDLGSELSLQNKGGVLPLKLSDLLAPPKEESLAQELDEAHGKMQISNLDSSTNSLNKTLMSPRSRRKFFGIPYESHYIEEILDGESGQPSTKTDKNMNNVNQVPLQSNEYIAEQNHESTERTELDQSVKKSGEKPQESTSSVKNGKASVKLRPKSLKSAEERKRDQKERNSLLFEEKRASLKVMGMV